MSATSFAAGGRDELAVATKLMAARTRLILDKPFIGALVMHLALARCEQCASIATDARVLYFNPAYIAALSLAQVEFVLAHEAMHCALGHFARRAHRVRERWDIACDHAVNLLLLDEGLVAPSGALADPAYRGLSAEEIYPLIGADTAASTLDEHHFADGRISDGSSARAAPAAAHGRDGTGVSGAAQDAPSAERWSDAGAYGRRNPVTGNTGMSGIAKDAEELVQQWRMRWAAAAQQALQSGRLPGSWQRLLKQQIAPQLSWRALLARYLLALARDDYSFQRPARREGEALLPRLSSSLLEVVVVLDTSGSIGADELAQFGAEIDALKAEVRARVTIHACDSGLAPEGPWIFEPWQRVELPARIAGGGGTSFAPVFEWIAQQGARPDALVYFTDAEGEFPPHAPAYPVLWIVKGRAPVPWGERIQLN